MFDADMSTNVAVADNVLALGKELLKQFGQQVQLDYVLWPVRYGKGIDDVINAGNFSKTPFVDLDTDGFASKVATWKARPTNIDYQEDGHGRRSKIRLKGSAKFDLLVFGH